LGEYRYVLPNGTARYQAFRIKDGVRTDLAAVSGSHAAAVNPAGQIAGTQRRLEPPGRASQQTHRAFLWGEGVITELGTLGGQWSQAEGSTATATSSASRRSARTACSPAATSGAPKRACGACPTPVAWPRPRPSTTMT
jgi:probable HAF family extracellular repeat protein